MDRRQQKTSEAIVNAFCNLLKDKGYEKITVQKIIDCANIGRSTFYSHFETKEMLLSKICGDLFQHVFTTTFPHHETATNTANTQTAIISHILFHIKNDNQDIVGILIQNSNEIFMQSFKKYFYEIISLYFLPKNCNKGEIPLEIAKNHLYCSFVGILQIWIGGQFEIPLEKICEYYISLSSHI